MLAPEKPFFLYYAPGACHAPHHAPKEWIDRFKGRFDMGYEAIREQTLARQKEMGIVPADTELPPINPIGTPETRTGPNGEPFPALDSRARGTRCRPTSSGCSAAWPRSTPASSRTPTTQIGRLLDYLEETGQRENTIVILVSDNGASGEGGPNGSVNENKFANGIPDDIAAEPRDARRARRPEDLQPLPQRLGDGVQHAVQDVEALRVQRRHVGPVHHLLAGRHDGRAASCASSTTTPSTSSRRSSTRSASSRPRRSAATSRATSTASACATASTPRRCRAPARRSSTRCSARAASGTTAGRPSPPTRRSAAGATSRRTRGSSTTPRSTAPRCTTSPRQEPERLQELINLWYAEAGANGAFPLDDRSRAGDHPDAAAAALAGRATATSTTRASPRCPESQAVNIRNRSYAIGARGRHPGARAPRACCSRTARASAATRSTSRTTGCTTSTASSAASSRRSSPTEELPTGERPDPVGRVRQGGRGPARRRGRDAVAVPRRREGRRGPHQDPAGQVLARRRRAVRRARQQRPGHRRLPGDAPWAFTGGTIHRVAVDVSGEPYVDLEREAVAMMSRE